MSDISLGNVSVGYAIDLSQMRQDADKAKKILSDVASAVTGAATSSTGKISVSIDNSTNNIVNNTQKISSSIKNITSETNKYSVSVKNLSQDTSKATESSNGFFGSLMKFRGVSAVFGEVTQVIKASIQAMKEYEEQTARVSRVTDGNTSNSLISAKLRDDVATYGVDVKDAGEGLYQLGTAIKDTNTLFAAQDTLLKLVVGTQSDARDTARTMVQIYEQFPSAFSKAVPEGENLRRVGELLAVTFKDANAEMGEISQALKYLGPVAEAAKIPLAQVVGVITALTSEGVRGRMGGTEAATFITRLIKSYDEGLQGIIVKNKVFHFELAKTADGGIDLFNTLKNIVSIGSKMPVDKQREYYAAVGGSSQAIRFLGSQSENTFKTMEKAIDRNTEALKGTTREADALAKKMQSSVFSQINRAWSSLLANMSAEFEDFANSIHLTGLLRDIADAHKAMSDLRLLNETDIATRNARSPAMQAVEKRGLMNSVYQTMKSGDQNTASVGGDLFDNDMQAGEQQAVFQELRNRHVMRHDVLGHEMFRIEDVKNVIDAMNGEVVALQKLEQQAKKTAAATAKISGGVSFSHSGDASKVNQNLLKEIQDAAKALNMKITVGTAITGHSANTINGNRSRHADGNAFDIKSINGLPANVNNPQGAALVDQLVDYLKSKEGFGFGEGKNTKGYIWRVNSPKFGGDHTNHLHVSDTSRHYNGPGVTDKPDKDTSADDKADELEKRVESEKNAIMQLKQLTESEYQYAVDKAKAEDAELKSEGVSAATRRKLLAAKIADAKKNRDEKLEEDAKDKAEARDKLAEDTAELVNEAKMAKMSDDQKERFQAQLDFTKALKDNKGNPAAIGAAAEIYQQRIKDANAEKNKKDIEDQAAAQEEETQAIKDSIDEMTAFQDTQDKAVEDGLKKQKEKEDAEKEAITAEQSRYEAIQDYMRSSGAMSLQGYKEVLTQRLGMFTQYSEDWIKTARQLDGVNDEIQAGQVEKDRATFQKKYGLAVQVIGGLKGVLENTLDQSFNKGFKGFFTGILDGWKQMLEQMLAQWLTKMAIMGVVNLVTGGGAGASGIFRALGFDNPQNDSQARHYGFDYMRHFSEGTRDYQQTRATYTREGAGGQSGGPGAGDIHIHGNLVHIEKFPAGMSAESASDMIAKKATDALRGYAFGTGGGRPK